VRNNLVMLMDLVETMTMKVARKGKGGEGYAFL
jgi:hypothetical protein